MLNLTATEVQQLEKEFCSRPWSKDYAKAEEAFLGKALETLISYVHTVLPRNSMTRYFFDKTDVVRCVSAHLKHLKRNSRSSMTIERDASGDWLVHIATTELLDDTETENS